MAGSHKTNVPTCTVCGGRLEDHKADLRFGVPDRVMESMSESVGAGAWMSGPDIAESDLLRLPSVGEYVRALLPVAIEGGPVLTYGVWVELDSPTFEKVRMAWWSDGYGTLKFDGLLANKLPFQHAIYAPVVVGVVDPARLPIVLSSPDSWTEVLLRTVLPHSALPS